MDVVDLPRDLFLLVAAHLSARTAVLCRRVSKRWNDAFADGHFSLQLLKWHFPRCREVRLAFAAAATTTGAGDGTALAAGDGNPGHDAGDEQGQPSRDGGVGGTASWAAVFASVASRYHHLRSANSMSSQSIRHGATEDGRSGKFLPVRTWDRHLRLNDKTAPFHYPDPGWCYSQEDGLLVYHVYEEVGECLTCPWRWLDLETRQEGTIPFAQGRDKVVRRVRLADGVLIFEWCGRQAEHAREEWPHLVTVYDVMCTAPAATDSNNDKKQKPGSGTGAWIITQRTEFYLYLGLSINRHSHFFSTHTKTHYAGYIWQGDRTSRDDHPIDVVNVTDISITPGKQQQQQYPRTVYSMTWVTLDFYGIRQRSAPRLRCLGMDDRNLYFTEEEHRWAQGTHSSPSPPRVHLVKTTGIPILPAPSVLDDEGAGSGQDMDGYETEPQQVIVQGPRWVDECGANGDVNMSFCSRAAGNPHHHHHSVPTASQHTLLTGGYSSPTAPGIWNGEFPPEGGAGTATSLAREVEAGIRAPTGRWPGWAPCWRHEEFPYLTVSEMMDFRAGVRVTARHCFMLETLSVHVRPSLSVGGLGGRVDRDDSDGEGRSSKSGGSSDLGSRRLEKTSDGEDGGNDEEVQFADEMWDALLGKGFICGDERWLIGEDRQGCITILRF